MNTVKETANAKVNLFLDVLSKREDGFHEIRTLMHPITLADQLTVSLQEAKQTQITMRLTGNVHVPVDERNLAYRAAKLFLEYLGKNAAVEICLKKNIPVAAGLAGGSADAAATLRAMNRLFKRPLSNKVLLSLAEQLGSDVPFCLRGVSAICEGRGEIMKPVHLRRRMYFVIALGNEYVSTPKAYAALDECYHNFDGTVAFGNADALSSLLSSLEAEDAPLAPLYNIFEQSVLPLCPKAKKIRERMQALCAQGVLMSGSGPSVFGIFKTQEQAKNAHSVLRDEGYRAFLATSL